MKRIVFTFIATIVLVFIPLLSFADVIYLSDGSVIKGDIVDISEGKITVRTVGGDIVLDADCIKKIEFVDNASSVGDTSDSGSGADASSGSGADASSGSGTDASSGSGTDVDASSGSGTDADEYTKLREQVKAGLKALSEEGLDEKVIVIVIVNEYKSENNNSVVAADSNAADNEKGKVENNSNDVNNDDDDDDDDNYDWESNDDDVNNDDDYNNDDYDWSDESSQKITNNNFIAFISFDIKGGVRMYRDYETRGYSLFCLDMGFKLSDYLYLTSSIGFPIPLEFSIFTETGFSLDVGLAVLYQQEHNGFGGTGFIEIQGSLLNLVPVGSNSYFPSYSVSTSTASDLCTSVMLNLVGGYNFRFSFFEVVTEGFIGTDFLRLGLNVGGRFGVRFYY